MDNRIVGSTRASFDSNHVNSTMSDNSNPGLPQTPLSSLEGWSQEVMEELGLAEENAPARRRGSYIQIAQDDSLEQQLDRLRVQNELLEQQLRTQRESDAALHAKFHIELQRTKDLRDQALFKLDDIKYAGDKLCRRAAVVFRENEQLKAQTNDNKIDVENLCKDNRILVERNTTLEVERQRQVQMNLEAKEKHTRKANETARINTSITDKLKADHAKKEKELLASHNREKEGLRKDLAKVHWRELDKKEKEVQRAEDELDAQAERHAKLERRLRTRIETLQDDVELKAPLVKTGADIRLRWLANARLGDAKVPCSEAVRLQAIVHTGNASAHDGDGCADAALLKTDFAWEDIHDTYVALYGTTPKKFSLLSEREKELRDLKASVHMLKRDSANADMHADILDRIGKLECWKKDHGMHDSDFDNDDESLGMLKAIREMKQRAVDSYMKRSC